MSRRSAMERRICATSLAYVISGRLAACYASLEKPQSRISTELNSWWKLGFLCGLANIVIWLGAGLAWWKLLGLW